jgi:DNA replication and repair protein RecF
LQGASGLLPVRSYASQGDQRTAALALKLAEKDLIAEVIGREPVLLLDDVFSELDPMRREWLADAVRNGGQTFISSADAAGIDAITPELVIEVTDGRASPRA